MDETDLEFEEAIGKLLTSKIDISFSEFSDAYAERLAKKAIANNDTQMKSALRANLESKIAYYESGIRLLKELLIDLE